MHQISRYVNRAHVVLIAQVLVTCRYDGSDRWNVSSVIRVNICLVIMSISNHHFHHSRGIKTFLPKFTTHLSVMCSVVHSALNRSSIACPLSVPKIDQEWFDVLSPEFLNHTPVHWLQFKPQPCSSHFTLAILYTLILIPGAFGNFLVISLFFRFVHDEYFKEIQC